MQSARRLAAVLTPSPHDSLPEANGTATSEIESRMSLVHPDMVYADVRSPAMTLQEHLAQQLSAESDSIEVRKYPPALVIAGTLVFCSAFWLMVLKLIF